MCPTLSTRFTEPLSCGPCVSISHPFPHGSTAVTVTRVPCSSALAMLLYSPFGALGASSKVTPSVRSSSLCLFTRPLLRPALPRKPRIREALTSAPFFCAGSSAAVRCFPSALTEDFRRIGLTFVGQDGGHPGVFARPVSSALMTSRGAHGTVLPISSFWVLLLGLMRPPLAGPRMPIVAPCPEDCRQ